MNPPIIRGQLRIESKVEFHCITGRCGQVIYAQVHSYANESALLANQAVYDCYCGARYRVSVFPNLARRIQAVIRVTLDRPGKIV